MIKLYSYWRSSAAYRVRIALNLKGLEYETVPVHMLKDGGEQYRDEYRAINPQSLVPTLVDGDISLSQSLAIMEYLDEQYPENLLVPGDAKQRAKARQLALSIACDIHPLDNLRVLKYLKHKLKVDDSKKDEWYAHWIVLGFRALEESIRKPGWKGPYCMGETVSIADICLVPQLYNAHRFGVPLEDFPTLLEIEKNCLELEAFKAATPEAQPDAVA